MKIYRYSEWDGSQDIFDPDKEELMDDLESKLMSDGDLAYALQRMQREGVNGRRGRRLPGLQELLERLRQMRQNQLNQHNLGSIMDEIRKKLDKALEKERQGIQRKLDEARKKTEKGADGLSPEMLKNLMQRVQDMAAQNLKRLDNLPKDIGGKIKELSGYDFMDEEARQEFQELMDMLKRNAMQSYTRDLTEKLKNMDASTMAAMRNLAEALNQMLEARLLGEEPDFEDFMKQFGDFFGPNPPQNLDELMEHLQNQMAQAQSLLDSMSPEDRAELQKLLSSMLDESTAYELAKLAANLEALYPSDKLRRQYPFSGEEPISFTEALKLMETLQKMDELESELKKSQYNSSLDGVDKNLAKELLGDEAAKELERLNNITRILEDAGYIRFKDGRYELTPRGMRRIGQKALRDVFAELKRDRSGAHDIKQLGIGGERTDETKPYEFGDAFQIDLGKTMMNALYREPKTPPLTLKVDDFEVFKTEQMTRSATVLMMDLSLSMPMYGNFEAAKRVAIALDGLIRSQYPKDSLQIIGFSSYARKLKKENLPYLGWDQFDPYTNIQHGLYLARKILDRETCTNKQIILISDGEPTAHIENGRFFFQYPPSLRTLQLTLREVKNCTQKRIVINTFMLESSRFRGAFIYQMARMNKGRVFFTNAQHLGQYLLLDYISNKKKKIK